MRDPNIPKPPPPETEPHIPPDPPVGQQSILTNVATVTVDQPKGTAVTTPITEPGTYYLRINNFYILQAGTNISLRFTRTSGTFRLEGDYFNITPEAIPPHFIPGVDSTGDFWIEFTVAGYGVGTIDLPTDGSTVYFINPPDTIRTNFSPRQISVNMARHPVVTISGAQNPVGTFFDAEINSGTFFVDFTWDVPVSAAFTASDINVTSSNSGMPVSKGTLENVGTVGTTTHYRMQFTVTGTGTTTVVVTVPAGAIPVAAPNDASEERSRTFEVNTFPSPVATFGAPQDA